MRIINRKLRNNLFTGNFKAAKKSQQNFSAAFFILWQSQAIHAILRTDVFTLPLPTRIAAIIHDNWSAILVNIKSTVMVSAIGLIVGSVIGYLVAVLATMAPKWGGAGLPIVSAFNAIPIVALAPVMTNWTKDVSNQPEVRSMVAKILVVMIVSIASMSINAYRGLNELKPFAKDMMASYAATKRQVFFKLQMPNSVPYIFTALKVSTPNAVISAIVSEYFAEYIVGVGREIRENIVQAQCSTAWAYIVVACAIGIIFYAGLMIVEAIVMKKYH